MELKKEYPKCFGEFTEVNTQTDTQFDIEINHTLKEIYLKFEGSRSDQDWAQNFNFFAQLKFHFKRGKLVKPFHTFFFVHRGLYEKYRSVRQEILSEIKDYAVNDYTVFIHGFSQGGGLTVIAHEDIFFLLQENNLDTNKVISYAFAPPMVFSIFSSKVFRSRFENLWVIRNVNDIVPKVPSILLGFRHYGNIIKLGKWKLTFPWQWVKEHLGYKKLLT